MEIVKNTKVSDDGYLEYVYYISDGEGNFLSKKEKKIFKFNTLDINDILNIDMNKYVFYYDEDTISDNDEIVFEFDSIENIGDEHPEYFI
jgi:hypothetical protein